MANSLGNAAHALDGTVATLQTNIATYLGAGGSARVLVEWLDQALRNADSTHAKALLNARLKGRPSPHQTSGATLVSLSSGAVYP
jgi:hypothetical protein